MKTGILNDVGELSSRGPLNIRKRLFRDICGVILVTVLALALLTFFYGRNLKDAISEQLISESSFLVQKRFANYRDRFDTGLRVLAKLGPSLHTQEISLLKALPPFLDTYEHVQRITISDHDQDGVTLGRSASGYVSNTLSADQNDILKKSDLFQRAMHAPTESPVVWMSGRDELSGMSGLSAAISMEFSESDAKGLIGFFIPADKINSIIADIPTPDHVDIIFYNREGMFLSRNLLQKETPVNSGMMAFDYEKAPAETRKALALWKQEGANEQSVAKFMLNGTLWWAGYTPLVKGQDNTWICIVVPETDIIGDVKKQWLQLGLVALGILLGSVLLTVGLVRKYGSQLKDLPHKQLMEDNLTERVKKLIDAGESVNLEFKSSMRANLQTGKYGKEIELAWLKSVVAFMNSDGGIILIGVADSGETLGIEQDGFANEDKCRLHFRNLINTHIGAEFARYIHLKICNTDNKDILVIECERVRKPVFLRIGKSEEFFVRSGPSSMKLSISQTVSYLKDL